MRRRIAIGTGLCLALILLVESVAAVSFNAPAIQGDRRVELAWMPDQDDPLYTGNLEIFYEGDLTVDAIGIGYLLFDRWGDALWAIGGRGELIARLCQDVNDQWFVDTTLTPLDGDQSVICAAIHPAGHLLAVGLEDGRIAIWRHGIATGMTLHEAHEGMEPHDGARMGIAFKPEAVPADSSYVSVGRMAA